MNRTHRLVLAAFVTASMMLVPACAPTQARDPLSSPSAGQASAPANIAQMSPSEKRATLGPDFPIEVPVPKGAVSEASSQGNDVYVYKLSVAAPLDAVAAWYRQAYGGREWAEGQPTGSGQSIRLVFSKAAAQSEVQLTSVGDRTQAVVSVGIGVPVGDTY